LDEDEYTEALSHIIARDFFPSLIHLDATNHYLDTLKSQDPHLINASVRRLQETNTPTALREIETPSRTKYGFESSETPSRGGPSTKRPRYEKDLSLDDFQARYTSEDNSSFVQILDEENRKRKESWAWAWDAQKRVEEYRERMVEGRERRLLEAPPLPGVREKFLIESPEPKGLLTDGSEIDQGPEVTRQKEKDVGLDSGKGKEVVLKEMEQEKEITTDVMAPTKDTRPAGVDGWKFKVCNSTLTA